MAQIKPSNNNNNNNNNNDSNKKVKKIEKIYPVDLFGGALSIHLPKRYIDLSNFRQIPDHQEVYSDANKDESIIIEILERVNISDNKAIKYHFNDISQVNESTQTKIIECNKLKSNQINNDIYNKYYCSYLISTQKIAKGKDSKNKSNLVVICLVLIRLNDYDSDILISLNKPIIIHNESSSKSAINNIDDPQIGINKFKSYIKTFKIKDLTKIFGEQ